MCWLEYKVLLVKERKERVGSKSLLIQIVILVLGNS